MVVPAGPVTAGANRSRRRGAFTVEPGHGLVLFSDGLVERRGERIDGGLDLLGAGHTIITLLRP
ncbi:MULTISPECIES: SpoIIE family protein phosphatase [Mycobacterium]|uniref:SpoIIE family protein phosphatase n=1 Tax=Mycobacterium TaxID=1763 RepID=UPI001403DB7C|nr:MULTISPECIES: SpoIIE family protein phosphatase [Mycobacterium]MDM4139344.1 SpoIIE family protein phosphatase [Mycobacterium sp. FLAC0960]